MIDNEKIKKAWDELDKVEKRIVELDREIRSLENLRDVVNKFFSDELHKWYSEQANLEYKRSEIFSITLEAYYEKGELCRKDITNQKAKESLKA